MTKDEERQLRFDIGRIMGLIDRMQKEGGGLEKASLAVIACVDKDSGAYIIKTQLEDIDMANLIFSIQINLVDKLKENQGMELDFKNELMALFKKYRAKMVH